MSTQFHVDTQAIATGAADVHRISATIETEVAAMMARLMTLEQAWRGSAAAGFQACITQWNATAGQVRAALDEIQRALATAGQEYASVEAANTAMFRS
ncbi:MAG: WXG100 family type VII secretion target [Austwickia sp.]|nr:WXG100 family type VII secretion target [Austwickia sp.]MBK8436293.1 WXG100 family type VII secretion target [Austwickia sp.]MBK9101971.1 WXG100 family type VII secretion target [Austwickia sp.]